LSIDSRDEMDWLIGKEVKGVELSTQWESIVSTLLDGVVRVDSKWKILSWKTTSLLVKIRGLQVHIVWKLFGQLGNLEKNNGWP
jgi:hypothetical protein